jgi:hypothetical protein
VLFSLNFYLNNHKTKKLCTSHFNVYLIIRREIKKKEVNNKKKHILLFLIFDERRQQTNRVRELLHRRLYYGWVFISLSLLLLTLFRLLAIRQDGRGCCVYVHPYSYYTLFFSLYPTSNLEERNSDDVDFYPTHSSHHTTETSSDGRLLFFY